MSDTRYQRHGIGFGANLAHRDAPQSGSFPVEHRSRKLEYPHPQSSRILFTQLPSRKELLMDIDKLETFKPILKSAFDYATRNEIAMPIDLAQLGGLIRFMDNGFSPQQFGYDKLRQLLDQIPDVVQVIKDDSINPPRYFAKYLVVSDKSQVASQKTKSEQLATTATPRISDKLHDFVVIIKAKWQELAELARPENWGDGEDKPLLRSYIRYTFARLVHEKKVKITENASVAAFNTGLVDRRFQPIFALLVKNNKSGTAPWFLDGFCVAGENPNGKSLVGKFNPLPEAAYYFTNPIDAFYDIKAKIYIDWEHVIEENSDRIPPELLSRTTHGFEVKSCNGMSEDEVEEYKQKLADYLKKDDMAYRMLIDIFNRALELALKKVRWNYKTAIPVYYPTLHKLSMLLPLCMLSEDRVDLALVVERTESGNYQGHTIYPLDWAYSNSRLIARPDSEWLKAEDAT